MSLPKIVFARGHVSILGSAKKLTVDFSSGNQSSDGGALLLRQAEKRLSVCRRLAAAMPDRRDPNRISHEMIELVMSRTIAICCGHEDGNDFDLLRHKSGGKDEAAPRAPSIHGPCRAQNRNMAVSACNFGQRHEGH